MSTIASGMLHHTCFAACRRHWADAVLTAESAIKQVYVSAYSGQQRAPLASTGTNHLEPDNDLMCMAHWQILSLQPT